MRLSQKLVISPDTVPGSPKMKVYAKFWEMPKPVRQYLLSFETASKKIQYSQNLLLYLPPEVNFTVAVPGPPACKRSPLLPTGSGYAL